MCRAMEEVANEAKQKERKRILKNLLVMGIPIEKAAKAVELPVTEVENLCTAFSCL